MILDSYKTIGGIHSETSCVKNVLTYHGINSPYTGKPFSEAMILGIGGGLGATYILWESTGPGYPNLVLAFRNKPNYAVRYIENLSSRLGATTRIFETTGKKKAAAQLEEVISSGDPAIAWVDLGGKPYYMHFTISGAKVVYGFNEGEYWVDHLSKKPYVIPAELMTEARFRIPSYKNRIMTITPTSDINIVEAINSGLKDYIEYMGASSTSFALPSIRKWARMMTDTKNKKGWPVVFKGGIGLYGTLRVLYESIEIVGTEGGGMRDFYADFLEEASEIISNKNLKPVEDLYRGLARKWTALAQSALPDQVDIFNTTKDLLHQRRNIRLEQATDGLAVMMPLSDELHEIKAELNDHFPMGESQMLELFADIKSQLEVIYEEEKNALAALVKAVESS